MALGDDWNAQFGKFSLGEIWVGGWAQLESSFLPFFLLWDHFVPFFCQCLDVSLHNPRGSPQDMHFI